MRVHKLRLKRWRKRTLIREAESKQAIVLISALWLAGCGGGEGGGKGSFDEIQAPKISVPTQLAGLLGIKNKAESEKTASPSLHLTCPQILVLDGNAAHRVYAGSEQTNEAVRYQFSIDDVARECVLQGDKLAIKVGVQGKVLLGPAGSPGSFNVPVKISAVQESNDDPIVVKSYRANVTIPNGQTEGSYTLVSDLLTVPFVQEHTELDYSLRVAVDEKSDGQPDPRKAKRHGEKQ